MILTLNPKTFQKEFLNPLIKIYPDGRCIINVSDKKLTCIVKHTSETMLFIEFTCIDIENPISSFGINLNRLMKGLTCLQNDNYISIKIENTYLECTEDDIKFNIKLLNPNIIPNQPKISIDNIRKHPIEATLLLSSDDLRCIKNSMSFVADNQKFYIENIDGEVFFEFGDRQLIHKDSIRIKYKDSIDSNFDISIFDSSILSFIINYQEDIEFNIGQRALIINIKKENSLLTYITAKLKK